MFCVALLMPALAGCAGSGDSDATARARLAGAFAAVTEQGRAIVARVRGEPLPPEDSVQAAVAPSLSGTTPDGAPFDLTGWLGSPVVLVFYRGHDCGLCLHRLRQLGARIDDYRRLGARVAVVSADDLSTAARTATEVIPAAAVVTVSRETLARWGVWPEDQDAPLPGAAIVDARGRIAFSHVGRHAGDRISDVDLLAELIRLVRRTTEAP